MKKNFKLLARFVQRFGPVSGVVLFTQFMLGNVTNLKLPKLKHPIYLRKGSTDIPTFYQVFLSNEYNISLKNTSVMIDAGANVGLFAVQMKSKYPEAKIICIEPDPENFEILKKNVANYDNIYCENTGLWDKETLLKVHDKYNAGKWAIVVEEDQINGTTKAQSVNSIMAKYDLDQVDVLKIDIETSEKVVFSSNYDWIAKVRVIVIELHDGILENCSKTFFTAINNSISNYKFSSKGENTIIENKDIK